MLYRLCRKREEEGVVTDEGITYDMLSYNHVVKDADKDAIGITVVELTDSDDNSLAVVGGVGELIFERVE